MQKVFCCQKRQRCQSDIIRYYFLGESTHVFSAKVLTKDWEQN